MSFEETVQGRVIQDALVPRVMRLPDPAQRLEPKDMPGINGVRIGEPRLDRGHAQPARTRRKRWAGRRTLRWRDFGGGVLAGAPRKATGFQAARFPSLPAPAASAFKRAIQRLGRVRLPFTFLARVRMTRGVTAARAAKSCAARPMRRSSGESPTKARSLRLSHGLGPEMRGQLPSFNPPSTTTSAASSRASSGVRKKSRGCGFSLAALCRALESSPKKPA